MGYLGTIITFIILVIIVLAVLLVPQRLGREKASYTARRRREHYGEPPGAVRAVSHNDLPLDRGWARERGDRLRREYEANTASAISHGIEWSA